MDYGNVYLINQNPALVPAAEVARLERRIGARMPTGYEKFVTTLGLGILFGEDDKEPDDFAPVREGLYFESFPPEN